MKRWFQRARDAILVAIALLAALSAHAQLTIEIIGGGATQTPIAIVPFAGEAEFPLGVTGVVGADLHVQALGAAMDRAPGPWLRADLQQMPLATESVALLIALDSLDQQGVDLPLALAELYRVLQPGGALLLRVSAHPWLEGPHDHRQRWLPGAVARSGVQEDPGHGRLVGAF